MLRMSNITFLTRVSENFSNISLKSLFRIYCILYVAVFIFVLKSENLFVLYCTSVRVCSTMLYRNQCWSVPPPDFSFPALGSILNINNILNYECKSSPNCRTQIEEHFFYTEQQLFSSPKNFTQNVSTCSNCFPQSKIGSNEPYSTTCFTCHII